MSRVVKKFSDLAPGVYNSASLSKILGNYEAISAACEAGIISKIVRGFYNYKIHPSYEVFHLISKYFPDVVISGRSALFLQGLSDFDPGVLEVAISREETAVRENEFFVVKRLADSRLIGVETINLGGVNLRIFSRERCLFEAAKGGPGTETFVKAINKYFREGINFEAIYELDSQLEGGDIIRAALQSLKESQNIY